MKKISLAKRNAILSPRYVSSGVVALVFAASVFLLRLIAPNLLLQVSAPAFRLSDAIASGLNTFTSSFSNAAMLSTRNEELSKENAALSSENQMLKQNSSDISALFGAERMPGITASVVARPPESPYDTLVLAAGAKAGVAPGMEAFGAGGVPIGSVSSVTDDFSRAILFSAPGVVTNGWVGKMSVPLTIRGIGAGAMEASVARDAGIVAGDVVFAPGPGQLPIGSVMRVDGDPLSPGVTLRIAPSINMFSTTWVLLRYAGAPPTEVATTTRS